MLTKRNISTNISVINTIPLPVTYTRWVNVAVPVLKKPSRLMSFLKMSSFQKRSSKVEVFDTWQYIQNTIKTFYKFLYVFKPVVSKTGYTLQSDENPGNETTKTIPLESNSSAVSLSRPLMPLSVSAVTLSRPLMPQCFSSDSESSFNASVFQQWLWVVL